MKCWYLVGVVGLLLNGLVYVMSRNPLAKYCDNMDLSTFCLIGNHFRQVVYDEKSAKMRYYPQFKSIVTKFFPPFYDVISGDAGKVKLWPWIQDNQDDIEYSQRQRDRTLLRHRVIKTRVGPTDESVEGYQFNLYSVNDICSLDKLYSPVYRLYTITDPQGRTHLHLPEYVDPPGIIFLTLKRDYRMYYGCGPLQSWTGPGLKPYVLPTSCPVKDRSSFTGQSAFEQFMENPFDVKVTEISFNGRRLHNYLHFQIGYKSGAIQGYGRGPPQTNLPPRLLAAAPASQESVQQGISYAFLIVHDQDGNPIGDFDTRVPCGTCQRKCRFEDLCYQAKPEDTVPCMFLSKDAVTHPGQAMFHFEKPMATFHTTWRFAQSASLTSFVREIHIKTLLILNGAETRPMVLVRDGRIVYKKSNLDRLYSYYDCKDFTFRAHFAAVVPEHCYWHSPKYGVFGWNAKYPILYPTIRTLGAWDYLNPRFLREDLFNCHVPLNGSYYSSQDYPTYGKTSLAGDVLNVAGSPQWEVTDGLGPSLIMGSKSEVYQGLSLEPPNYYTGVVDEKELRLIRGRKLDEQKYMPKERQIPTTLKTYAEAQKDLRRLRRLEELQEEERCRCARFGTAAPPPEDKVPPIQQLDGRRDHSIQMAIAWIALVPFAIFVSRYYKETYSKVFFLQEFWWYTMHVLTFFLAVVFMLGGIYAIEIKREEEFNWADHRTVLHAILGATSVILFILQFFLGAFRLKRPLRRRIQIFLHWFLGISNYFLAIGTMFVAAFIRSGCMGCPTLIAILVWLIIQLVLYIIMEIHMRMMDKQMNLNPKRSYLPPPVMRVFHKDAPGSKFRIIMLVIFAFFSTLFYGIMHFTIEFGPPFRSCFFVDEELEAIQLQYIRLI